MLLSEDYLLLPGINLLFLLILKNLFPLQVHHYSDSGVWELRIRLVSLSDGGLYECQGNSSPKQQRAVQLAVEDTVAVIAGPKHRYIPAGQELQLSCSVDLGPHGPDDHYRETAVLHWLVNRRIIDPGPDNMRVIIKNTIGDVFQVDLGG